MTQINWSKKLIEYLALQGVKEYIVCAGARNAALVKVLQSVRGIKVYSFFEERSAGYFALGRIKKSHRSVAVVTTSGTAVGNLMPPVMEAYHSELPLIVISADRPESYRASGAPQATDQLGIFSSFAETLDVTDLKHFSVNIKNHNHKPVHINVCFHEPLIDDQLGELNVSAMISDINVSIPQFASKIDFQRIQSFTSLNENSLLYMSGVSADMAQQLTGFLHSWNGPIYLEGQSNLKLPKARLVCGEWGLKLLNVKSVIRVGNVPTTRFWRDLEKRKLPVLTFSDQQWPGLSYIDQENLPLSLLTSSDIQQQLRSEKQNFEDQSDLWDKLDQTLSDFPACEVSFMSSLQQIIPSSDQVFIGNSMPIREWDVTCNMHKTTPRVFSQRGLNGIDGLISTGIGLADNKNTTWIILGDLSSLYDLSGVWPLVRDPELKIKIVIINNSGGKIFQRVFDDPNFENRHGLSFKGWADMWGLSYKCVRDAHEIIASDEVVLELQPNNMQSKQFWNEMSS